jgi:Fic family protein
MYIWEHQDWPRFRWDAHAVAQPLEHAHLLQGRLLGRMERFGLVQQDEAALSATTDEVVQTADIEGESLNRASVRSSLARRIGLPDAGLAPEDRRVDGIVDVLLDATRAHKQPLTKARLCGWQAALFPTGRSGLSHVQTGAWRDDSDGPMQVVSGPIGRSKIDFKAPPAAHIDAEMAVFLDWFEQSAATDGILGAAIAHLWFVTIHPFEDGNGRLARVLADMRLARSEQQPRRFYSLSREIRRDRGAYYTSLERTQKGDLDVTAHLLWFLRCFSSAIAQAGFMADEVLRKAEFWHGHAATVFNTRQIMMLNTVLDGFDGKLTARKWALIAKCSPPTAQRDIRDLLERGVLVREEGGSKNTSYRVA